MTFKVVLDEAKLYGAGLQPHEVDKYRGFMPMEQYVVAIPFNDSPYSENDVIREFSTVITDYKSARKIVQHLGSRHGKKDGLYIEAFKSLYPKEKWEHIVNVSYKKGLELAKQKIKTHFSAQLALLKKELSTEVSAQKANAIFYGRFDDSDTLKKKNELIFNVMSHPKIVLDSACYVRMIKQ